MTNCVNSVRAQIYLINVCTCKIRYSVSFLAACGNRGYEDVKSKKDINVAKFFILDFHVEKYFSKWIIKENTKTLFIFIILTSFPLNFNLSFFP